jgi:hypothetical protein
MGIFDDEIHEFNLAQDNFVERKYEKLCSGNLNKFSYYV